MNDINKLFYDDKYYLLGFNKFYEKIKQKNINISKTEWPILYFSIILLKVLLNASMGATFFLSPGYA